MKVSEKTDKSQGMEYATRGHREAQKSETAGTNASEHERTDQVNLGRAVTRRSETRSGRARAERPRSAEE